MEPLILELLTAKRKVGGRTSSDVNSTRVRLECEMEKARVARCCQGIVGLEEQETDKMSRVERAV